MGEIQDHIYKHLNTENSFVKSIQCIGMSDGDVTVPKGFNVRFIGCTIGTLTARDSALHLLGCKVQDYDLWECIASIDGGEIGNLMLRSCRVNAKKLHSKLSSSDTSTSELSVNGSLQITQSEVFLNDFKWEGSQSSTISNSRVEIIKCEANLQSELKIEGSEFYFIKGSLKCSQAITIKELEKLSGNTSEQDMVDFGSGSSRPSTNNIRGTAGVGAGSIAHFKDLEHIQLGQPSGQIKVEGSECNITNVPDVKSEKATIIHYTDSCGKISNCKQWFSPYTNIHVSGSGNIHVSDTKLKIPEEIPNPTVKIDGKDVNFTVLRGEVVCEINDTFQMDGGFLELHEVDVISACNNDITIRGGVATLNNCKAVVADNNCFEGSDGCVVESNNTQTLDAAVDIFKGDNATFILRGETKLKAGNKDVEGSGVFVAGAPEITFEQLQDVSKYNPSQQSSS